MNLLKPKKTMFNERALIYRRITGLERTRQFLTAFSCLKSDNLTYNYYLFDVEEQEFVQFDPNDLDENPVKIFQVANDGQVFQSGSNYFYWNKTNNAWVKTTTLPQNYSTLQNAGFSNIGKYQTNKYIYMGSIDYVITGEVAGTKTQPIKGAIMPLTSMNIKYYDDFVQIEEEDLVVIDGHLFSAENPDFNVKHSPRPYNVYYVTLNSIL